ncbi:MAG TPA: hypothetical protein VF618_24915 [Thermoanaerobaculia bacterium]
MATVDWESILTRGDSITVARALSVRGKNLSFARDVASVLQLDDLSPAVDWRNVKAGMSAGAVRAIHEAVVKYWPDRQDAERVLHDQREEQTALFVGTGRPQPLLRGIARHSLYSDVVLVLDPFHHAEAMNSAFNPIRNPAPYRSSTLAALQVWWMLLPWIEAGIVRVVRAPTDYDPYLFVSAIEAASERYKRFPVLRQIAEVETDEIVREMPEYQDFIGLSIPDSEIRRRAYLADPNVSAEEVEALMAMVEHQRDEHPFYTGPIDSHGSIMSFGDGANYDIAKLMVSRTRGYLVTDQRYRWKEIELDRQESGVDEHKWSSFAKAFQSADVRFLDTADLELSVLLREEMRLRDLRHFFRKVWQTVSSTDSFDDAATATLAAELHDKFSDAEDGWRAITRDLLTFVSAQGVTFVSALACGSAELMPASAVLGAGVAATALNWRSRRSAFADRHAAAFFVRRGR